MKTKLLVAGMVISSCVLKAQDVHFSQFVLAPLFLNPANAGAENKIRAIANYREQWKSVASPFKTVGISYDMRISESESGFFSGGITFFSDRAGDAKMGTGQGNINLAYHLRLKEGMTLGMGLMGGYAQRSVNTSGLQWGNQYDGTDYNNALPTGEPGTTFAKSYLDAGAGVVWTYIKGERYITGNDQTSTNLGFSVMHVNRPNYSFYGNSDERLYMKYVFHGNAVFGIPNSRWSIAPAFYYQMQGGARELLFGSLFKFRLQEGSHFTGFISDANLAAGVFYRNKDAVILKAMLSFANYSLGFSYDMNVSKLKTVSDGRGGFEIALRFIYPFGSGRGQSTRFL